MRSILVDVFLSNKAFMGLVLSAIEVYRNECLGSLLGYNIRNRIVVESVIPYQTAKRKPTGVEPNWKRESRVQEILPNLIQLQHVGYFHSHTQWGKQKASTKLSDPDIEGMIPTQIEIIVAVNDSKRKTEWYQSGKELGGSIGKYHLRLACHYKRKNGTITQYPILCPYILGFDLTFQE
jgi:proteasome lid subunit RPN8/RPN11